MIHPLEIELATSGMTRAEFNRLPVEPWQKWLAAIVLGGLGGFAIYQGVTVKVGQFPIYYWLAAGAGCFLAGGAFWFARDIRSWRVIAVLQVFMGCVVGALAYLESADVAGKWGGVIGAVVAVADGLNKFRDLHTPSDVAGRKP